MSASKKTSRRDPTQAIRCSRCPARTGTLIRQDLRTYKCVRKLIHPRPPLRTTQSKKAEADVGAGAISVCILKHDANFCVNKDTQNLTHVHVPLLCQPHCLLWSSGQCRRPPRLLTNRRPTEVRGCPLNPNGVYFTTIIIRNPPQFQYYW